VRLAYAFIGNQIGQLAEQFISLGAGPGEKIGQLVLAGSGVSPANSCMVFLSSDGGSFM
jgi:hypothetical protein